MKIKSIRLKNFKRFDDLTITGIPQTAKLVVLTGPNGSGKSSLFEGFNFWSRFRKGQGGFDLTYHCRDRISQEHNVRESTIIDFHDYIPSGNPQENRKCFYIRSAYRYEADFTTGSIHNVNDPLESTNSLGTLMQQEQRVSENYNRIVGEAVRELFNGVELYKTKADINDRLIGEIRRSMISLFGNLILSGTGNPSQGGTFRFDKGNVTDFHYKNLSGGEKSAFDQLLDFIVKKETFNDTVFCIDEPELHMHTKLQGGLLNELFQRLPDNCQMWISTHSIGMARKAAELSKENPGLVTFIDFHNLDFDQPVRLEPKNPTYSYWENMFDTALDDLSKLVVPAKVIFCEGRRPGVNGHKASFDVQVYSKIFSSKYYDVKFIPLGGTNQVEVDGSIVSLILKNLAPGIQSLKVFDRDDRSVEEIKALNSKGVKVLSRRDLESYLWSDEILTKLAVTKGRSDLSCDILSRKNDLLAKLPATMPSDDIKAISGDLYNFCKTTLCLTQCGNDAESFAITNLAPLITDDTETFQELDAVIFGDIKS